MDKRPGGETATMGASRPSLQDYLRTRRPESQANSENPTQPQAPGKVEPIPGTPNGPAALGQFGLLAADGRSAVPVEHAGMTLSRDAEKLRYPLYDT
jgi:hypothetical protein